MRTRSSDLTAAEQQRVRVALRFLRVRFGGWAPLAAALHVKTNNLSRTAHAGTVTASLTFRLARLLTIGIDDLLLGAYPPAGSCPLCGNGDETHHPAAVRANGSA